MCSPFESTLHEPSGVHNAASSRFTPFDVADYVPGIMQAIKPKYTVVNRAPVMMAWAFVVAERLGFQREEALSIGKFTAAF